MLLNSVVASPALKYRIPLIQNPPEEPLFDMNMMQKDLKLALEMGQDLKVPLPTTALPILQLPAGCPSGNRYGSTPDSRARTWNTATWS